MTDIAHLGLAVDSAPVAKAAGDLDRISAAAKRAEQAATGMSDRVSAAGRRVEASNTAVASSANRVAASVSRMSAPISQVEAAYDRATMAAKRFVVANDNAASFRRRNLTYQLFDVGQMAALGQNPAMLLMQQGPQIAQIYAGNGGVNAAFKDLGAILGGIATKIGPLAALAGIAAAGFFGLQQAIQDATGEAVSFGDTFKAVFQVIGGYIYDELEPAITAIAPYFEAAWEAVKEYTTDAFNFIVATVVSQAQLVGAGAQAIVIGWQAAYDIIKTVWNNLPQIMGDLTIQTAQAVVDGTETMINEAIGLVNKLIETANIALTALGADGIKALSDVDFGEITNPWKGEAAATADAIKDRFGQAASDVEKAFTEAGKKAGEAFNTDFAGSFFDDVSQQAVKNMEDRLRDLKKEAKEAKDAAAELKRQFEAFQGRADNLLEDFFPGEAARREAHELIALLDQFGGQLDDMQRKAVEMRIDEMFTAAAMGLRDLNGETRKGRNNLSDMEKEARKLEDALKDAASNFLQDLFTGKDVLESIVQLGSRFASMNFDNFVEGMGNMMGGKGFTLNTAAAKANAQVMGKAIGTAVVPVLREVANDNSRGSVLAGSVGSYTSAISAGKAMAQGVVPAIQEPLNRQVDVIAGAIRKIESGNNYGAVGMQTKYGKPLGAYQILESNLPQWSQQALGRVVSASEFLGNRLTQDQVAYYQLTKLLQKYNGRFEDVASVWNSGRPLSQSGSIVDPITARASTLTSTR
ncbi:MAG: phage tail length tape measure family protein [Rhodobiaceae bacterium]|nr:phage tail length tape measure family protein [Rhodobiaceae bacterium]